MTVTPFGARLRAHRRAAGMTQADLARALEVTPAYLSALEHGRKGRPGHLFVHRLCAALGLIWEDADELQRLARHGGRRVIFDTAKLRPDQTALVHDLADAMERLTPAQVAQVRAKLAADDGAD